MWKGEGDLVEIFLAVWLSKMAFSSKEPILMPNGKPTYDYQNWVVVIPKPGEKRRQRKLIYVPPITWQELVEDRFGTVLHSKLDGLGEKQLGGRLFEASHYYLQYKLPDSPFTVNVRIDNPKEVKRAYREFELIPAKQLADLAKHDMCKIVPRDPKAPPFNTEPKRLVKGKLVNTTAMTNWLAAQYLNGRVDTKVFDKCMEMRPVDLRKEVFAHIPAYEQPDHAYLDRPRKEKKIPPEELYRMGQMTLAEYADYKAPHRKEEREKRKLSYPRPERTYECIICHVDRAQIKCMECDNRACSECVKAHFIDVPDKEAFLLLHHMYCLRFGRPSRAFQRARAPRKLVPISVGKSTLSIKH